MMLALLGCSLATGLSATASDTLQQEIQAFIDSVATESGFSFSVGYVDENTSFGLGAGPRSPKGYNVSLPGTVRGEDTMLLGSGTKPFTAAAIMRSQSGRNLLQRRAPLYANLHGTAPH